MIDKQAIVKESIKGASVGGTLAAAGSIVTHAAIIGVPVKILGVFTVATATVISTPVVLAVAATGVVVGGAAAAVKCYRKQKEIEAEFDRLTKQ